MNTFYLYLYYLKKVKIPESFMTRKGYWTTPPPPAPPSSPPPNLKEFLEQ